MLLEIKCVKWYNIPGDIKMAKEKRLLIKGHDKNPFVKFWNWGWGIYYKNPEIWNYLIVGGLTTLVSIVSKWLLFLVLDPKDSLQLQIAVIISWILSVSFAYITNRIFVFQSKSKEYIKEISTFVGGRVLTLVLEMIIMGVFVTWLHQNEYVFTILSQVIILVLNYIISKLFVFKKEA